MNLLRATNRRAHGAAALVLLVAALLVVRAQFQPARAATPPDPVAYAIDGQAVNVIDAVTNARVVASPIVMASCPVALAITPDARYVLVVLSGNNCFGSQAPTGPQVVMIDTATNALAAGGTVSLSAPGAIAISPDGSTAYVTFPPPPATVATQGGIAKFTIGPGAKLTANGAITLGANVRPSEVAVSPDGQKLYVLTGSCDGTCLTTVDTSGTQLANTRVLGDHSLRISPDGTRAFIANHGCPQCPIPGSIDVEDLTGGGNSSTIDLTSAGPTPDPTDLAIGTKPDGTSTLYAADSQDNSVIPIPLSTLTPGKSISLVTIPDFLAATPDGNRVEVTTARNVAVTVPVPGGPQTPCPGSNLGCPAGGGPVAITPDFISPAFNATAATAGQPSAFDASGSSFAFWTQVSYTWAFGDGSSATTTTPTTTHTYANAGTYTVQLTESDGACTAGSASPGTIFTGQTMTRRCGSPVRKPITIPAKPSPGASPTPTPSPTPPPGTPVLTLNPIVGPPGIVVAVSGSGFTPNATVVLAWQPGIGTVSVKADGSGSFHTFALVFSHDRIGKRQMAAQGTAATAQFLVVPPTVAPGGHDAVVVFRR